MKKFKILCIVLVVSLCAVFAYNLSKKDSSLDSNSKDNSNERYTVLDTDIPDFEMSPIDFHNKSDYYLVEIDGKFAYIDNNNQILQDGFDNVFIAFQGNTADFACGYTGENNSGKMYDGSECGGGFGGTCGAYFYYDGTTVKKAAIGTNEELEISETDSKPIIIREGKIDSFDVDGYDSYNQKDYYIWNPASNEVYGPYERNECATFDVLQKSGVSLYVSISPNEEIHGPFYVKTENGYVIYSEDGKNKTKAYDYAQAISNYAIKVVDGDKMGIVNNELSEVFMEDFEDVSNPIDQKCYVKKDGSWMLIQLKNQ